MDGEKDPPRNDTGQRADSETARIFQKHLMVRAAAVGAFAAVIFFILVFWIPNRFERFFLLLPFAYATYRQLTGRPVYKTVGFAVVIGVSLLIIYPYVGWLFGAGRDDMVFRPESMLVIFWHFMGVILVYLGMKVLIDRLARTVFRRPIENKAGLGEKAVRTTIGLIVFIAFFLPLIIYMTNFHRPKFTTRHTPQSVLGAEYENITLTTSDNVSISAWFIPAECGSETTVIFSHGISANKGNFLTFAEEAWRRGANALIYDSRGHGDSGGWSISLGYREKEDIKAVVRYLKKNRPESAKRIIAWGCSAGSAPSVLAAAEMEEIDAVILDSAITSFADLARDYLRRAPGFVKSYAVFITRVIAWLDFGVDIEHGSPLENIHRISPRPVFIVAGLKDGIVPPECSRRLYKAAREPKHLLLREDDGHVVGAGQSQTYSNYLTAAIAGGDALKNLPTNVTE
ncbi:MAG: alpha/beta hydrolase [Planctomycetota bacterium]|jgi:fermentation-respiration switch protein FrsA (DUF1100 family)